MAGRRATSESGLRLVHRAGEGRRARDRPVIAHVAAGTNDLARLAPVMRAIARHGAFGQVLVHTGAEDEAVLGDLLGDARARMRELNLGTRHGSEAEETANALVGFEQLLYEARPDVVVVAGDDASALAAALSAVKLGVAVGRLDAGLRSWDWSAGDEVNRVLIDRLSDTLFTHAPEAGANLDAEGIPRERTHDAGNTLIDTLRACEPAAQRRRAWERHGLAEGRYVLVALQRLANGDGTVRTATVARGLAELSRHAPVLVLVDALRHLLPAWCHRYEHAGVRRIVAVKPEGYVERLSLEAGAGAIVTDSGPVQEEASGLGVPCHTLRPTTERAVTLTHGTNVLVGEDPAELAAVRLGTEPRSAGAIPRWDGRAGERVAGILVAQYALSIGTGAVS
jgi:UDP-N-acetylglucosamine 2-epimerase (non-hydrolysing)